MKKLVLIAAIAALSACSQKTEESKESTPAPAESMTPAAPMAAADSGTQPGTYEVKMADGTMGTTVINADGTYADTDAKGKVTKGKFAHKDGKDCFDPDGAEPEMCWTTTTPAADGSFTATSADGKATVTVTPKKS